MCIRDRAYIVGSGRLGADIPGVAPAVVKGVGCSIEAVGWIAQRFEVPAVSPRSAKTFLYVADGNPGFGQRARVCIGIQIHELPLASRAESGHERYVEGIAAAFVI